MGNLGQKLERLTPLGVLLLRLWVGASFLVLHGWPKIQDAQAFIGGAAMAKFPAPFVFGWAAILAEFLGGLLLTVGLLTRPAAVMLLGAMVGAAFVVHGADPILKRELALTYGVVALFFVIHGGGRLSLDRLVSKGSTGNS